MAAQFYGKMWIATSDDLNNIMLKEMMIQATKPVTEPRVAHGIYASLFVRYVVLVNNLGELYDQCLQVQKREVLEKLLIQATLRMKELEAELMNIEISEYLYLDQKLIEMKIIPQDIRLLRPCYFPMKRPDEIQDIIDGVRPIVEVEIDPVAEEERLKMNRRLGVVELTPEQKIEKQKRDTIMSAVLLIKMHEKARQARSLATKFRLKICVPKQLPGPPLLVYDYKHKPGQRMLKLVRRTQFRDNFMRENIKQLKNVELYESPNWRKQLDPNYVENRVDINKMFDEMEGPGVLQAQITDITEYDETEEVDYELLNAKNAAASIIQRAYHKFKIHQLVLKRKLKKLRLFNMADEYKWDFTMEENILKAQEARRKRIPEFAKQFTQVCEDTKAKILKLRSPSMMEDISDHIRTWFREWYDGTESFDRYPEIFEGGTIMVIWGQTRTVPEYIEWKKQKDAEKAMSADKKKQLAEKKKQAKEKEKAKRKKEKLQAKKKLAEEKKRAEKQGKTWQFDRPEFVTPNYVGLQTGMKEYHRDWVFIDELANTNEAPYMEFINPDEYSDVHKELRQIVDEFMRIEFELLRMALAKDKKKKYKPQKVKKEKKKGKKNKKKKKDVKPLIDRPLHEVFDELLEQQIIQQYPQIKLDDYVGDISYAAYELRNNLDENPMHFAGEIIHVIRSSILGMGPLTLPKTNSMCIVGQPMSGKRMLVDAICTETDAVLFDISPKNIGPIEDIKQLIKNLTGMAKLFQPAIFFIDGCHKPYYKKVPPEEAEWMPKKIAPFLKKFKKTFQKDRVMLLGTTDEPWKGQMGKLKKAYEKCILIPADEYTSTFQRWRKFCLAKRGVDRNIAFISPLAMATRNFSSGRIYKTVEESVDIRRRMLLSRKPLDSHELLNNLLEGSPYQFPSNAVEFNKYLKFYRKLSKLANERFKKQEIRRLEKEANEKKKK